MQKIVDQRGYLNFEKGGQILRNMYSDQAEGFDPTLLSTFAFICFTGNLEAVKMAVESGKGPDLTGTEGALKFGYATLVVSGKRHIAKAPMPMKHAETLTYLLSKGCPPDVEDIAGFTALTHSTQHKASSPIDLARILLVAGANVNHRDRYGQVPILSAFMTDNIPSIELLMEFGADLDIGDADGCIPSRFYVQCGPQVAATVSKWLRKRSGEEALLAEKQCGNCKSTIRTTIPIATFTRQSMGIPTDPTPERHTRGPRAPKSSEPKSMIIKVQVPYLGPDTPAGTGDLMVYTKKRDFVCQIKRADKPAEYDRISQVVRSQGVGGAKAYFSAELVKRDELIVKVSEALATQPSSVCNRGILPNREVNNPRFYPVEPGLRTKLSERDPLPTYIKQPLKLGTMNFLNLFK
ncbi:hypothetical protein HWV62_34347 [Athelia sp. TMB]|nr:hypothetical protein HWV62_34347 [Athelia sp. TMB]